MNQNEIELIVVSIKIGKEEALSMKIYKNGILTRRGCGATPELGISGMSFLESSHIFDSLVKNVPPQALQAPFNHEDSKIHSPVEYLIAFYGDSKNGDRGERAEWSKSTGLRFYIDQNTSFRHPGLGFIDNFAIGAATLTNSWYFDIIINGVYGLLSKTLPKQTMIATPPTDQEKWTSFENYLNQIKFGQKHWNITDLLKDKTYINDKGESFHPVFTDNDSSVRIDFVPGGSSQDGSKKWWKVW